MTTGTILGEVFVHPDATIGEGVVLDGRGGMIRVAEGAYIGHNVVVNRGSYIGPGVYIGSGAIVGPNSTLGDNCTIGENAVLPECTFVPMYAMVSAMSYVRKSTSMAPFSVYGGVPAKFITKNHPGFARAMKVAPEGVTPEEVSDQVYIESHKLKSQHYERLQGEN